MMDVREKYTEDVERFHVLLQETGELQDKLNEAELELAGIARTLERVGIDPFDFDL